MKNCIKLKIIILMKKINYIKKLKKLKEIIIFDLKDDINDFFKKLFINKY